MSVCTLGQYPRLSRSVRKLPGSTQPILAEASDGHVYVVKFPNHAYPNLLFNEAAGTELYRAFDLPVPAWSPLIVPDTFLDQNPACRDWIGNRRWPSKAGLYFGSRFLGETGGRPFEILPGAFLGRVSNREDFWLAWLLDICAQHADNRQAIFLEDEDRALTAFFVDHGHMFAGPKGEQAVHFAASRFLDGRIYPLPDARTVVHLLQAAGSFKTDSLWQKIQEFPDDWKTPPALQRFEECLDMLAQPKLLAELFDLMVDSVRRKSQRDRSKVPSRPQDPLLRAEIPASSVRLGAA